MSETVAVCDIELGAGVKTAADGARLCAQHVIGLRS
jgi:hypothetical protein